VPIPANPASRARVVVIVLLWVLPMLLSAADEKPELLLQTRGGFNYWATSVAFTPDGHHVVTTSGTDLIQLWDTSTVQVEWAVRRAGDGRCLAITPDGRLVARQVGPTAGWHDYAVELLEVETGATVRVMSSPSPDPPIWMAFSPDGRLLAVGTGGPGGPPELSPDRLYEVVVLDTETGAVLQELRAHESYVVAVGFTPDGKRLISASADGLLAEWDAQTGQRLGGFQFEPARADEPGHGAGLVALSGDGSRLAVGRAPFVDVYDVATGKRLGTFGDERPNVPRVVAISGDGRKVASAGWRDAPLRVWDVDTGVLLRQYGGPGYEVGANVMGGCVYLAFSPDGADLVVGSNSGGLEFWNVAAEPLAALPNRVAGFVGAWATPDGSTLIGAHYGGALSLWDAGTGELRHVVKLYDVCIKCLAVSPDSQYAVAGTCGIAKQLSLDTCEVTREINLVWGPEEAFRWVDGVGATQIVWSAAISPGPRCFALGRAKDIQLRDWTTGAVIRTFSPGGDVLAFSPDGRLLAATKRGGGVQLWDVESGAPREGTMSVPSSAEIGPDGARMVVSHGEGLEVRSTKDGRVLATLILLQTEQGGQPDFLAVTPEGYYTGTTNAGRNITWRVGKDVYPLEAFRDVFNRPDLVARALRGESLGDVRALTNQDVPPRVTILRPEANTWVTGPMLELSVVAQGPRKVLGLEVYCNGRRAAVEVERAILMEARSIPMEARSIPMEAREPERRAHLGRVFNGLVPLPAGDQQVILRVVAVDEGGLRSRPAEVGVLRRDVPSAPRRLHVLAAGITHYADSRYDLFFAGGDASALAQCLRGQAGEGKLYAEVDATVLADEQATASALRDQLRHLVDSVQPQDTVVLFLAGHGLRSTSFQYYFGTHDLRTDDLGGTALAWEELQTLVRSLKATHVLVLLDTCHAAAALGGYGATTQALGEALADRAGVMVLASSASSERSFEREDWGHGAYTKALLEALQGKAGRSLTPGVLEDYVGRRVAELTGDRQHPYVPIRTQFPAGTPLFLGK